MPELPEVETLRRGLEKYVVGHTIETVEVKRPKIFQGGLKDIEKAKIIAVRRFGKGLVIDLSNNYSLAIHIKLTGQLIYRNSEIRELRNSKGRVEVPNKFTSVIFKLGARHPEYPKSTSYTPTRGLRSQNGRVAAHSEESHSKNRDSSPTAQNDDSDKGATLFYNDIRQFGWIKVVPTDKVGELPFFKELGPEFPLINPSTSSGQKPLTSENFSLILSKSKTAIKPLIMDQQKMAGVGNIYANDALYLAKIDPKRPANSLSPQEVKSLYNVILKVLEKGLQEGGASELTFVNVLGESGNYQNHTQIYGKNGEKCKRDGTTIKKIMLGGRGTYFCPECQK